MSKQTIAGLLAALLLVSGMSSVIAAPAAPDATWQTILSEPFEGTWPGGKWTARSLSGLAPQYWGQAGYRQHAGAYSVWPAAGGSGAITPGAATVYPDYMNTQLIYGPFDLSDALDIELRFWMWMDVEQDFDFIYFFVSHDGATFTQLQQWSGNTGDWAEYVLNKVDYPTLAGYQGDASVWVRWDFASDDSNGLAGPFLDDVTLRKVPLSAPTVSISRSGSNINLNWSSNPNAASYEIWRAANAPYFTPGANCAAQPATCTSQAGAGFTHSGGSGSVAENFTYVVVAVNGGIRSLPTNRVGEFDFALVR